VSDTIYHSMVFISEAQKEEYEERAAIMEFEGGMSREEAEKTAFETITGKTYESCKK